MRRDTRRDCFELPKPFCFAAVALLAAVAIALYIGMPIHRRLAAIHAIEGVGGSVDTTPGRPTWLRDLIGNHAMELFEEVRAVYVAGTEFSDLDMPQIRTFRHLDKIDLDSTRVTDAGLVFSKGQSSLTVLDLSGLEITDDCIESLKELKSLTLLDLDGTRVTDAGVANLKRALPGLTINK